MSDVLIDRLTRLADELPVADSRLFADAVVALLHDPDGDDRRRAGHRHDRAAIHRRRVLVGVLAIAAVAVSVVVLPGPRGAIARWFGLDRVRIERVPSSPTVTPVESSSASAAPATASPPSTPPPPPSPSPALSTPSQPAGIDAGLLAALGPAVSRTEVAATGLPLPTPTALGAPLSLHVPVGGGLTEVVALYAPSADLPPSPVTGVGAIVTVASARADSAMFTKMIGPDTAVESFMIDGDPAIWLEGAPHEVVIVVGDNAVVDTLRLATNTLLWQHDGLLLRIEATISRDDAVRIARTWEPPAP